MAYRFEHNTGHHKTFRTDHKRLSDIHHTNVFLNQSPKTIEIKTKTNGP